MHAPHFIADVHLGRLARMLRMLGWDTAYDTDVAVETMRLRAAAERRVLLTRSTGLAAAMGNAALLIHSKDAEEQFLEVVDHFSLKRHTRPFTRCMACNGLLQEVIREKVRSLLPEMTAAHYTLFWQCEACGRLYWQGPHYTRMQSRLDRLGLRAP